MWLVIVPPPAATLKTVPKPDAPPPLVVPKRLPLLSAIRPPTGKAPLVSSLHAARVVIVPLPAALLNAVPQPAAPPPVVVRRRLLLLAATRPAGGAAPLP